MPRRRAPPPPLPPGVGPMTRRRKLMESRPPPEDPISNLPDDILGEIISLLPVKDGARTRILAYRWRHLWHSAPLNIDSRDIAGMGVKLNRVVSRILSSHPGPVRRFCFSKYHLSGLSSTETDRLRSHAVRNLEELEYSFFLQPPAALLVRFSPTLRALAIGSSSLPDGDVAGLHFPLLKHLGLKEVGISEGSLHSLIDRWPALESLLIHHCFGFPRVRISSLTIRSIGVDNLIDWTTRRTPQLQELIIDNAPCLERLLLLDPETGIHVSVATAPKLETIGFLSDGHYKHNEEHLSRLAFGSTIIQGLRVDSLPMAVCTVKILALRMRTLCLDTVLELLKCFQCLEKLYIEPHLGLPEPNNLLQRKHRILTRRHGIRLKTIVLKLYRGIESQVNFVKFFLLKARMLKMMNLQVEDSYYSEEFAAEQHKKLQLEKRASRDAQFRFTAYRCIRRSSSVHYVHHLDVADPFEPVC